MVFSSITFLLYFLPITLTAAFLIPSVKGKNIVLLVMSLLFYAWGEPVYVLLMLISIGGNYLLVRLMSELKDRGEKVKSCLAVIVIWNLAILGFYKYANMLIGLAGLISGVRLKPLELSLPIGISFYTFQALSYVIDVYRGKAACQKKILPFALYITMFPQLIAGPIVKYTDIEERLENRRVTLSGFGKGAERFIFGLSKKVLLANTLGAVFTGISGMLPETRTVLQVWLGAFSYAFQIYFDFSGYSDMAIGLGYMLGFRFPENFRYPYMASSVTDFWRRWHISLSSWFRDYVYIPLGGNRVSAGKHIRNLLIVWALTGLWHGASLNFVIWGLYYALFLILEKYVWGAFLERHRAFGRFFTLLIVLFGWILFSFTDFQAMSAFFLQMFGVGTAGFADRASWYLLKTSAVTLLLGAAVSTPYPKAVFSLLRKRARIPALILFTGMLILSLPYLVYQSYNPFLYFRF